MASARIQRWALTLSAYQYSIRYKAGHDLANADSFSRLPRAVTTSEDKLPGDLAHLVNHLSTTNFSAATIKDWTAKDPVLSKVLRYLVSGWPSDLDDEDLRLYHKKLKELSTMDGCVMRGSRVVVPPQGRKAVLEELHSSHPGCGKMKALARSYVWWPGMDAAIDTVVKECRKCQETRPSPPAAPTHPWEWPAQPWSRLHLDFAGPFMGHQFLVLVDSHSKWLDAHIMSSITSGKTIEKLRQVFSTHGLPRKIVTDNGLSFTSSEFRDFLKGNGIIHVTSAPYHPATNGLVERGVQTLKQGLKKIEGSSMQERLSKFLFGYRLMPHSTTGVSPAEMLMGRRLRSRIFCPQICQRRCRSVSKNRRRIMTTANS